MVHGFNDGKNKIDIIDLVYPVGSIYMSVNSTNPSTIFGGTWEAWGTGRVPVGVDSADADFNEAEMTGGEKTHTLTTGEIPSHAHSYSIVSGLSIGSVECGGTGKSAISEATPSFSSINTGSVGSGSAHNNLQPYITCYMWKRTE